ncbi:hypothetical protein SH611_05935 [Geminicoccaceae bacterium 1502E]|nr:hypothetical protein [Geminicoccaceae bacterium 1502E]
MRKWMMLAVVLAPLSAAMAQEDEFGPSWPEGPGREEIGYFCGACHSLDIVKQQGLSRGHWDELLTWMSEYQNMPPLEGEERDLYLDYLAANFGEERSGGSAAMPAETKPAGPGGQQGISLAPLPIRPRN